MTQFSVQLGDVLEVPSDLLLLKHAQSFYGADRAVAERLLEEGLCSEMELRRKPGEFAVIETMGLIAPKRVMFLGTPPLSGFTYDQMQAFSRRAIQTLAELKLPLRTLTTTVHGAGYGLDGGESLQRLLIGFKEGLSRHGLTAIEKIIFLTLEERAERMLVAALHAAEEMEAGDRTAAPIKTDPGAIRPPIRKASEPTPAPFDSDSSIAAEKRRVFVAMPFSDEFQNVYEFGIYPAVRNCGLICERVDETHFTGDVLGRIRDGIESASFVIADLTEGRPNVYLEVGYAWGKGVPVIFVARKGEKLHFDVSTHRCIYYGKFTQFAEDLEKLIRGLESSRTKAGPS